MWAAVALLVLTRFGHGLALVAGLRRRSRKFADPAGAGIARRAAARAGVSGVAVLESDEIEAPLTVGVRRPAVLLPAVVRAWTPDRLEAVLIHEFSHIRRGDLITNVLARVACAVYWFHPLAWRAARRLRNESERACDDLVLRSGEVASRYAVHLVEIAGAAIGRSIPQPALSAARPSDFEGRVLAILESARARHPARRRTAAVAGVVMLLGAATLSSISVRSAVATEAERAGDRASAGVEREGPLPGGDARPAPDAAAGAEARAMGAIEQAGPDVAEALTRLLRDPEPKIRAAAAHALGEREARESVPELIAALEDPVSSVRENAAYALGKIEDPAAVEALGERLSSDRSDDVREVAAWALGETEDVRAVAALVAALDEATDRRLRARIVRALGETRQPAALPVLDSMLIGRDSWLGREALEAVARIGTPAAKAVLVRALTSPDPEVRSMAVRALGGRR